MNDTDVQATNTDYKPKLHKNDKLVLQIWLVNGNVVPNMSHLVKSGSELQYKGSQCLWL